MKTFQGGHIVAIRDDETEASFAEDDHDCDDAGQSEFGGLLGSSAPMTRLRLQILRAAPTKHAVLVTGPTGAGKELVAKALHDQGGRGREPFLDINCGAIPEQLMESQLFGHERGAFTGADRRQDGYLAAVRSGTLFLDEVAELPLALQAKLLRVLETRRFRRVGSLQEHDFAGRIVAATHVNLQQRIEQRLFREDLFYRLNVLTLRVPSLEERRADIPRLVGHFVAQQGRPLRFMADALSWLTASRWPGNVRELKHVINRIAVFSEEDAVTAAALHELATAARSACNERDTVLTDCARAILRTEVDDKVQAIVDALIDEAMAASGGNKSTAAKFLGIHRKVVERLWFSKTRAHCPTSVAADGEDEVT